MGLLLQLIGSFLLWQYSAPEVSEVEIYTIGISLGIMGTLLFFYGIYCHVVAKGYSRLWTILGLLGILGVAVIILLPSRYEKKLSFSPPTNLGMTLMGILIQSTGVSLLLRIETYSVGVSVLLVGGLLFLYGCYCYSIAKGYPGIFGLLGLFGVVGLFILAFLPDRLN